MTTLSDVIARARSFGRDSGGGFLQDEDYAAWCNEAQADIAARLKLFEEELTTTVTSGNTLGFPSDPELIEIQDLLLGTEDRVQFVDSVTWDSFSDSGSSPSVTIARVFEGQIELYPTPAIGEAVTLRYKHVPEVVENGSDALSVPTYLERKVVAYMVAMSQLKDGADPSPWLDIYEQGLPPVNRGRDQFFTGPLRVTREPNIWDRQLGASHL